LEKTHHRKRAGGVAQGVGPKFKLQHRKKKKKFCEGKSQWFMPVILAAWEAEIWKVTV
jgi:hypothetical protein